MPLRTSRRVRAAAALMAVTAYTLPLVLGLLADLGHGAHHALEELREARRAAAELGLVYLHHRRDAPAVPVPIDSRPGVFVHTHGGELHSHDAATDALFVASGQLDEDGGEAGEAPTVKLSTHLPGGLSGPPIAARSDADPPSLRVLAVTATGSTPTPPPPRA